MYTSVLFVAFSDFVASTDAKEATPSWMTDDWAAASEAEGHTKPVAVFIAR